jgi:hypothetical protein
MDTSKDRILEALESHANGLCDDCLEGVAAVHPRQQVNQICRPLSASGAILRAKSQCPACGTLKLVNSIGGARSQHRLRMLENPELPMPPRGGNVTTLPNADRSGVGVPWDAAPSLDELRRQMIRILDRLDGARQKGEGLAARIGRLRDSSLIPSVPACMMLTLNALRNIAVYESKCFGEQEREVVVSAWASVQGWLKTIA